MQYPTISVQRTPNMHTLQAGQNVLQIHENASNSSEIQQEN